MARAVARTLAAPLLFLNMIMYFIVLGFASWCINRHINGTTNHPSMGGNGATPYFLTFSILAAVLGIVSKVAGGGHLRAWRSDSLAGAGASAIIAWAVTALAFGLACKEINIGGYRGWRLKVLEAFIIILGVTQLLYVMLLHAGIVSSRYGPGYRNDGYGGAGPGAEPVPKGAGAAGTRV
ncbi:AWPM-19-like family protein [Dorcoceras hygrometricum]|uniref:AWPM-19-like family protein n=1 Tax=Dorcoceras hygrometricum TaxID=472368 RepID=A0A2Z7AGB0_9LAMI|nr:AWPM-19-like family protein [Dorcoceras hygrometricum]